MAGKGIRLRTINIILAVAAAVVSSFLFLNTYQTVQSYNALKQANQDYIVNQQNASMLEAGSDYLTDQVRLFVVTGDRQYADNFFAEVNVTQRRDNAVAGLEERLTDTRESALLREALELSNRLVLKEYDAIRLTILSNGYDPAEFPEVIGNIDSSFYDLTPDEQRVMAEELVFGNDYQQTKKEISDRVDECVTNLVEENRIEQERSSSELRIHLTLQVMWVAMLLVIVLFIVLSSMELVIMPLERAAGNIRREEPIPETGSREMRFLVHAYNEAFDKNKNSQEQLAYKAAHDPLTGLNNRGVFEKVLEKNDRRRVCLIIIDIDYFKQVNDTRGHEAGDLVLKRVSSVITRNFREEDYICRIGGDEFAVVMVHADSELTELVRAKIRAVQEELSIPVEDVPAVTLSVGVAFSDHVNEGSSLYKDADKALYYVKEKGRNGLAFFDEINGTGS